MTCLPMIRDYKATLSRLLVAKARADGLLSIPIEPPPQGGGTVATLELMLRA